MKRGKTLHNRQKTVTHWNRPNLNEMRMNNCRITPLGTVNVIYQLWRRLKDPPETVIDVTTKPPPQSRYTVFAMVIGFKSENKLETHIRMKMKNRYIYKYIIRYIKSKGTVPTQDM